jgi:hypothetical protein
MSGEVLGFNDPPFSCCDPELISYAASSGANRRPSRAQDGLHRRRSVLADPRPLPYLAVDLGDLKNLLIPALAAERCPLHLWTLPNRYHVLADELKPFRPNEGR